ncbi:MAG: PAS domain-containing protein, partial [Syntrophorhabdaceae bacterium]|nr:PAS domain-containing protein [Syntrophorhabdaceae bacterium]
MKNKMASKDDKLAEEVSHLKKDIRKLRSLLLKHKNNEKILKERCERLEMALEAGGYGFWDWDLTTNEAYFSPTYYTMLGYEPGEFPANYQSWYDLLHPEDRINVVPRILEYVKKGQPYEEEFRLRCKDGSWKWISGKGKFFINGTSGIPYRAVGIHVDITERKIAEKALIESKKRLDEESDKLRTISENAPFGIVLIDRDGRFEYVNPKFMDMFGYDRFDVPDGRTWFKKAYPDQEYRRNVIKTWLTDLESFKQKRKAGERPNYTFTVTCRDGSKKTVNFIPVVLANGGHLLTCEDITERLNLESQLRQAQKTEAIGTLAGGIAHDFNNILTALMGYAALIKIRLKSADPLMTYVDQILTASQKAADLIKNLLMFSRKQPLNLTYIDVNKTIKSTEKLLKRLLTEDIELNTKLTDENTIIIADQSHIDQILFNLATNARDAMPNGGRLTIETEIINLNNTNIEQYGFGEPGRYVLIRVTDTGMGIDKNILDKIFDPFFTTKEIGKGTGLGLATVYGIVKQHNGYINVESTLNIGTTFYIYLPAISSELDHITTEHVSIPSGNETILVAEDNEDVRNFLKEALIKYGYKVIEAQDGDDAINKFATHRDIDLVILDTVMPKKNGLEAFKEINKLDPDIKVIFMSGYSKDIVIEKGVGDK